MHSRVFGYLIRLPRRGQPRWYMPSDDLGEHCFTTEADRAVIYRAEWDAISAWWQAVAARPAYGGQQVDVVALTADGCERVTTIAASTREGN